jgi:valine--pyruvate aminotransferase
MKWRLSTFGESLSAHTGINELMRDLGTAMSGTHDLLMLGGGNPAHIPAVEALWRERWHEIAADGDLLERTLGNYDTPQGNPHFLEALADSLANQYGWAIGPEHIAVVNGSQNAFFYLLNMLAGRDGNPNGRMLLPLAPEYIGYANQMLGAGAFRSLPPRIELIDAHRFKYHIDFDRLTIGPDVSGLCVSRPTNPTGNVLTHDEVSRLESLAGQHGIPLIIDNAYGAPFPDIIFNAVAPLWTENTILVMSLSKLGLPGTRTGIILGPPELIASISAMNAVIGLANGNVGQVMVTPLLRDGRLYEISRSLIRPYYERKSRQAMEWIDAALPDTMPYRIHISEGALFLWIWFEDLPISSEALYQRLKKRSVLVVSGHYFFYGLEEEHAHQHACVRLSYAQNPDVVQRGVAILAEEAKKAYAGNA